MRFLVKLDGAELHNHRRRNLIENIVVKSETD